MDFESNIKGIERIKNGVLCAVKHKQAQINTINRLATIGRNNIQSGITDDYNLSLDDVKIRMRKADKHSMTGKLIASKKKFSLMKFDPVQAEKGVKVQIKRDRRSLRRHTFLAEAWGDTSVLKRKKVGGKLVPRLPILKQKGLSIGGLLGSKHNREKLNRIILTRKDMIYKRELERLTGV